MKKIKFILLTGAILAPAGALTVVSCSEDNKDNSVTDAQNAIGLFVQDLYKPEFSTTKKEDTKTLNEATQSQLDELKQLMNTFNSDKTLDNYKAIVSKVNSIKSGILKDNITSISNIAVISEENKITFSSGEYKLNLVFGLKDSATEITINNELKEVIPNIDELNQYEDGNELKPVKKEGTNTYEMSAYFPYKFDISGLQKQLDTYDIFQKNWSDNIIEGINFQENTNNTLINLEFNNDNNSVKISYNDSALIINVKTHPNKILLSELFENELLIINKEGSKYQLETNADLSEDLTDDNWTAIENAQNLQDVIDILKIKEGNILSQGASSLTKGDKIDWNIDKDNHLIEFYATSNNQFKIQYILEVASLTTFADLVTKLNTELAKTHEKTTQETQAFSLSLIDATDSRSLINVLNEGLNLNIDLDAYFLEDTQIDTSQNDIFDQEAIDGVYTTKEILFLGTNLKIDSFNVNYRTPFEEYTQVSTIEDLKNEINSADGITPKKILLTHGEYEINEPLLIDKNYVEIFGETTDDPSQVTIVTNKTDMNKLISVEASNVKIANMRLEHKIINTATSVETTVSIKKAVSNTTIINNTIHVPEFAISGIMMSNTQIINNKFYYDSNISGTSRVIGIYGASQTNYIRNNSLDLSNNTTAKVIFIYSSSNNPGTGEPSPHFEGQLIVRRNDITTNRTVTGFYSQDAFFQEDIKTYSIRIEENKVRESSYFVSLYLTTNNQANLFSSIELVRNDISNKHNDKGESKGILSLDGFGTDLVINTNPISVNVADNTLENTDAKREDYSFDEDYIGYKTTVFGENRIIKK